MNGLRIMVYTGRVFFVVLLLLQCAVFNVFFMEYSHPEFMFMTVLYIPSLITWSVFVVQEGSIHWLWFVLGSHIWFALVPYLVVLLSDVVDSIDESETLLGFNSLKLTISISPVLVLLMLNTGPPREKHRELLKKLSVAVSLEMFDVIEILEMLMENRHTSKGIPDQFKLAVGVFASISLLATPLELMEILVQDSGKIHILKAPFTLRFFLQVVVSNCAFLAIRLVVWLKFGQEASIFLVKNVVKIASCCFEVCIVFEFCGCAGDDGETT